MKIVCRTSNRLFVGLPLCKSSVYKSGGTIGRNLRSFEPGRNPDYMELNQQFTIDVVGRGQVINMFPNFLKPWVQSLKEQTLSYNLRRIVGRLVSNVSANLKRAIGHVGPMIKHHLEQEAAHGAEWQDKPVSGLFHEIYILANRWLRRIILSAGFWRTPRSIIATSRTWRFAFSPLISPRSTPHPM